MLVRYRGAAKSNHTKACGVARRLIAENADREALKTERRILVRDYETAEQRHNRLLLFTTEDSLDKEALWFDSFTDLHRPILREINTALESTKTCSTSSRRSSRTRSSTKSNLIKSVQLAATSELKLQQTARQRKM